MRRWLPLLLFVTAAAAEDAKVLSLVARIDLPNVEGRIDHFSADLSGRRLFVSALGNRTIEVLDAKANRYLRNVTGIAEPQGVLFDPVTDRLFAACRQDGTVRIYDGSAFHPLATVALSGNADNLRYDTHSRHVVVGYGDGALAFLTDDGKKSAEIALDAHPESFQLETTGTRVFVNVPDRKEIQVADVVTHKLLARWPVTSASHNFPMALDESGHRLFIGCRSPARLLALDVANGKEVGSADIVGDTDDLFYDSARKRIYVIGGEGYVDVLALRDGGRIQRVERLGTAPGARTGLFVSTWNRLFVAVPKRAGQRAQILVFEIQ